MGRSPNGGGATANLKKKIEEFGIDISHFKGHGWSKGLTKENCSSLKREEQYSFEELFQSNSNIPRKTIRRYIIRYNILEYCCKFCGNKGEWLGKIMSLELDHINGVNNDNRLENLRWLCPNCHAITETYSGKNNRRIDGNGIHT